MKLLVISFVVSMTLVLAGCGHSGGVSQAQKQANGKAYFQNHFVKKKHKAW